MKTAIHWFRRDLRITDNTALTAACQSAENTLCVYVQSAWTGHHRWTGTHRQQFLCGCLESLDRSLRALGGRLIIRRGDPVRELLMLARAAGAGGIFWNRDPDPHGRDVEQRLAEAARQHGIAAYGFKDHAIHERDEVLTASGSPYRVFTPYARAWMKLEKPAPGVRARSLVFPSGIESLPLPTLEAWGLEPHGEIIEPGETAARERLTKWLSFGIERYARDRNTPGDSTTSRLSQDLRHGLLSIREVFERCINRAGTLSAERRSSVMRFVGELIWREFFMQILWHFPEVLDAGFNPALRSLDWPGTAGHFRRWREGETGFPIVDAAMRQLNATGFMPNRARMIVAMFLTKDLHVDWRLGESYFMQQLADGEIASNNGGWQWSAGTGADAAPWFRIQNPWIQTKRHDPEGAYIKRWLPELRDVPAERFQRPPSLGNSLAQGYPPPMVDHAAERQRAIRMLAKPANE